MNECYQQNLNIIASRWPALFERLQAISPSLDALNVLEGKDSTLLINGVQLTSRHNRQAEAELQARKISAMQPVVELYGTGMGDLQQELLQRKQLKKLNVHILNENIFLLVIQLLDQQFWLNDPRVTLQFAADHPDIKHPFVVSPSELELASDMNNKIKMRLIAEEELFYFNEFVRNDSERHASRITESQSFWSKDNPVQKLYRTLDKNREAFVIATGPSLEKNLDYLKKRQQQPTARPFIISVDTALKPLLQHGIVPDIVVTVDIRINTKTLFTEQVPAHVALVYFPLTHTEILQSWQGPRYVALNSTPLFDSIRQQLHANDLFTYGSVIHPALDLAVKMGSTRIALFGADFAYANNKTHTGWQDGALGQKFEQTSEWTLNGFGEKVKTLRSLQNYLIGVERYISQLPHIRFYNTSRAGSVISGTEYYPELVP
ncbi:DUF115 domain-containing protein [Chromatiaceae bacterium AAb-1]|nr:DUF115 domain-containing protein [Chromatiaceae bacterium AAb-1]